MQIKRVEATLSDLSVASYVLLMSSLKANKPVAAAPPVVARMTARRRERDLGGVGGGFAVP